MIISEVILTLLVLLFGRFFAWLFLCQHCPLYREPFFGFVGVGFFHFPNPCGSFCHELIIHYFYYFSNCSFTHFNFSSNIFFFISRCSFDILCSSQHSGISCPPQLQFLPIISITSSHLSIIFYNALSF